MPWYLYLAWKYLFPSGKRVSSFFYVAVLGIALGVAVLVVVQSVMGGFGEEHRRRIVETAGHIDIGRSGQPLTGYEDLVARLSADERVRSVHPYAMGFVLATRERYHKDAFVMGLPTSEAGLELLRRFAIAGEAADLDNRRAFVSADLANALGLTIGSTVDLVSPTFLQGLREEELILPSSYEVAGIFSIDWAREVTPSVIVTLPAMQELYGLGEAVHGITIFVKPGVDETALARELNEVLPFGTRALTWRERFAEFLWVLDLEKTLLFFILLFVLVLAGFAISSILIINVIRKTREIGLLASMGARSRHILALFLGQGLVAGILGSILGLGLGLLLLWVRNPIVLGIATLTGTRDTLVRFYYFAYLPARYSATDYALIVVFAVLTATLAALPGALRAARRRPVEALRTEF